MLSGEGGCSLGTLQGGAPGSVLAAARAPPGLARLRVRGSTVTEYMRRSGASSVHLYMYTTSSSVSSPTRQSPPCMISTWWSRKDMSTLLNCISWHKVLLFTTYAQEKVKGCIAPQNHEKNQLTYKSGQPGDSCYYHQTLALPISAQLFVTTRHIIQTSGQQRSVVEKTQRNEE